MQNQINKDYYNPYPWYSPIITYNNQTTNVIKINDDFANNLYFNSGRPYDKIVDDKLINEANELFNHEKFFGRSIWKTTTDDNTKIIN